MGEERDALVVVKHSESLACICADYSLQKGVLPNPLAVRTTGTSFLLWLTLDDPSFGKQWSHPTRALSSDSLRHHSQSVVLTNERGERQDQSCAGSLYNDNAHLNHTYSTDYMDVVGVHSHCQTRRPADGLRRLKPKTMTENSWSRGWSYKTHDAPKDFDYAGSFRSRSAAVGWNTLALEAATTLQAE